MVIIVDRIQIKDFQPSGSLVNPHALYNGDNGGPYTTYQSNIDGTMRYYTVVSTRGIDTGSEGSTYKLYSSTDRITWSLIFTS